MFLPTWLYAALPYLYVGVGFLVLGVMDHPIGHLGGATLVAAGIIVWLFRRRHRRTRTSGSSHSSRAGTTGSIRISDRSVGSYYNNYD
jgi:hypothetical protein